MTTVVGDTNAITASFLSTWLHRASAHVESSAEAHLAEMLRVALKGGVLRPVDQNVSDGFHTFAELYRHRMLLNAALFRAWSHLSAEGLGAVEGVICRSLLHHDGEAPFGGGWFIVVADLPTGQVSWHYPLDHWDLFAGVLVVDRAPVWDGHTADQAADRLQAFLEET